MVFYFIKAEICALNNVSHFILGNIRKVSFFEFGSKLQIFFFNHMPNNTTPVPIILVGISIQYHSILTMDWYISAHDLSYELLSNRLKQYKLIVVINLDINFLSMYWLW